MPIEGTGSNGVLIFSPGGDSLSPSSPGGAILERALHRLGLFRSSFWIQTGDIPLGFGLEPRAILALGSEATQLATGTGHSVEMVEGYVLPPHTPSTVSGVVPTFHPKVLRAGKMSLFGCLVRDIKLALDVARGLVAPVLPCRPETPYYLENPLVAEARAFAMRVDEQSVLAYDIETPHSGSALEEEELESGTAIRSIQFSLGPGTGIYLPWRDEYIPIARKILEVHCTKIGWNNWRFDNPRLRANGCDILGTNHDLMWMWHHLQPSLPRNLQFAAKFFGWPFPWKHLSGPKPELYGIYDVDALSTMYAPLVKSLTDAGIWSGYEQHVLFLEPILAKMCGRGIPIDRERFDQVSGELDYLVTMGLADLQKLVPDVVKPRTKHKVPRIDAWKPSNQGLQRYAKFRGHELPRDSTKKVMMPDGTLQDKITFDQLRLKRIYAKTKDPLYKAVLDYKDAATVLNSHLANWKPGPDGRVHSTFYYIPVSGQLSSRRPNIQNAPRHKSDLFRSIIRAKEGKVLIEFDYKSFHALTLGFEAGCTDYMRLARLDIHSYVTAHLLKLPDRERLLGLPDEALGRALSDIKNSYRVVRDRQAKPAILGYGFGLGARKLFEMYREYFANQREAQYTLDMLDSLFPKVAKWRNDIRIKAHTQGYLVSRFGFIRRFYEVLRWTPGGMKPGGEESEEAIAFLPANDAFGCIKQAIRKLAALGFLDSFGFINTIHDSLLFECSRYQSTYCIEGVKRVMEFPNPELDGLVCEVSVSMGPSWSEMKEVTGA